MEHGDTAQLAAVVGALGAVLVLLARTRPVLLSGFGLLAVAEAGLLYSRTTGFDLGSILRPAPVLLAAAGLLVVAACALPLVRWPAAITPLVLAAAPFRLPIHFDPDNALLVGVAGGGGLGRLLPLYAVLGASALAFCVRVARGNGVTALPPAIAVPAAAFVALAAVSLTWTRDLPSATNLLAFFLLPFAVLVAVVGRAPFPPWLPRVLAAIAISLACLFAVVGIWQRITQELLFFSTNVEIGNTYSNFFRVTSLFRDPSLYGRHLVLGIAVLLVVMWLGRLHVLIAAALASLVFAGLYFSYSQSSLVALFVAVVLVTAIVGDRRGRQLVLVTAVVLALVCAGAVAAVVKDESLRRATSDRSRRVESATQVFRENPIVGVGLGAQPVVSQEIAGRNGPTGGFVSHTTPLTVAGELGLAGLAAYLALLVGAARTIELVRRRDPPFGAALAASLATLFVHSLFYSGFVEDPVMWLVLGVGASYLAARAVTATEPAAILASRSAAPVSAR